MIVATMAGFPYVHDGLAWRRLPTIEQVLQARRFGIYAICQAGLCTGDHTCTSAPEPARSARVIEPAPHTTAQEDAHCPPTPPMAMTERGADTDTTTSSGGRLIAAARPRPTTADQDDERAADRV